jgi:hypothetical protein
MVSILQDFGLKLFMHLNFIDCTLLCIVYLITYVKTVDTTNKVGISSIKTTDVGIYVSYVVNVNVTVLHVSTIHIRSSSGTYKHNSGD